MHAIALFFGSDHLGSLLTSPATAAFYGSPDDELYARLLFAGLHWSESPDESCGYRDRERLPERVNVPISRHASAVRFQPPACDASPTYGKS